jgi:putative ABC transport system permease protein
MLKNYLKIALRNLFKHKAYSLINIFGLAIGIACCMLILAYIIHETGYEDIHKNREQIYRVAAEVRFGGRIPCWNRNTPKCSPPCVSGLRPGR